MLYTSSASNRVVGVTALATVLLIFSAAPDDAVAQQKQSSIEGSWSGGGRIVFPSGDAERASCRASFSRRSANTFRMSAVCATPSVRIAQSGTVERVSGNTFAGSFFNSEYNVSGDISIIIRGDRLSAQLRGGGGSGSLNLSR